LRIRGRSSKLFFLIYPFAPCRIRHDAVGVFVHVALSFAPTIDATVGTSSTIAIIITMVMATITTTYAN
jgi:hypothetical protein